MESSDIIRGDVLVKYCSNCGIPAEDDIAFCAKCGNDLRVIQPQQPPPAPEAQPPAQPPGEPYYGPPPPGPAPGYQQGYGPPPPGHAPGPPGAYVKYAGFWIRWVAAIIDGLVLGVVTIPLSLWWISAADWTTTSGGFQVHWQGAAFVPLILLWVIQWGYYTIMTGAYGATLGKMALKLKVVRATDMQPVSYGTAALREIIGKFVSGFCCSLGYIWAGFDSRKQGWHDKIASTVVLYK